MTDFKNTLTVNTVPVVLTTDSRLSAGAGVILTDNGNGTATITGSSAVTTVDNLDGTGTITVS